MECEDKIKGTKICHNNFANNHDYVDEMEREKQKHNNSSDSMNKSKEQ
jgi:hypothetical protein